MKIHPHLQRATTRILALGAALAFCLSSNSAYAAADKPADFYGIGGGLVVQLGTSQLEEPIAMAASGRHLVQILDPSAEAVTAARGRLHKESRYGLVSAERLADGSHLPYAENLVNLLVIRDFASPLAEIFRVLTPLGKLVVTIPGTLKKSELEAAGFENIDNKDGVLTALKPWPEAMDGWTHARHHADGNAVSEDTVVGLPERVRWIAAATSEVEGMVSSEGKNFYGGMLARDSFNGLRLWHRDLGTGELDSPEFNLPRLAKDLARPVAAGDQVVTASKDKLEAFEATTGKLTHSFEGITKARDLLSLDDLVIASDTTSVRAFDLASGAELWAFDAAQPRNLVAGDDTVIFIQGLVRRGEKSEAVALDLRSGKERWRNSTYPWLERVTRTVLYRDYLAFEVSTMNNDDLGNSLHVVSSKTGAPAWEKSFPPGMNHRRQARAMFVDGSLWILHGSKINTADPENMTKVPVQVSALDLASGETMRTLPAGMTHCFPPVATPNFVFAGELDLTDMRTGEVTANRITKANCSSENGWIPANGLVYTSPKHCTCWPMLRGYVAMAPVRPGGPSPANRPLKEISFRLESGPAKPDPAAVETGSGDWPLYRGDPWRSGSSAAPGPASLDTLWSARLASELEA
ncbi:MAG: PQQ-binding-like beta-propeller repeat protein, partial [Verrucomicrobiales bacterium]